MTTRECYFKAYALSDLNAILMPYIYKDYKGVVQLGSSIPIRFSDGHEENVLKMESLEKSVSDFMFWANDPEWVELFKGVTWKISDLYEDIAE